MQRGREAGGLDQEGGPGLRLGLGMRWSPQDFSRGEGEERRGRLGVWPEQLKGAHARHGSGRLWGCVTVHWARELLGRRPSCQEFQYLPHMY